MFSIASISSTARLIFRRYFMKKTAAWFPIDMGIKPLLYCQISIQLHLNIIADFGWVQMMLLMRRIDRF